MRKRIAIGAVAAAFASVALSSVAYAGDCNRLIHGGFEDVGHVCLGPRIEG